MTRKELAQSIYNVAHLKGEFLLRSGAISNEYFDKYQFEAQPKLLSAIANALIEIMPKQYDYLAALEMGGIPIATAISLTNNDQVVFVRKEAKKYGTSKFAEGPAIVSKHLLIVEDVVTSGGQIIISANDLRKEGATITQAICVIDRQSSGREKLAEAGIELISLFTMSEIKEFAGV
jgi:orotate phosphoribosyltransferase